jgi:3-hydroxyacyl-CoA dehydrogenase
LKPLLNRIEQSSKPVVAAIHGVALGGGLELAMACHYRVAVASAQLGLPEVNLGIIPGADGTQRLPRLVGLKKALEMCVSGRPIRAREALETGLIDEVVEGDLTSAGVAFAERVAGQNNHRRTSARTDRLGGDIATAVADARARAAKIRPKQSAPGRAIEAVALAATLPFDQGSAREDAIFDDCVASEQAKALIHVFFAERTISKLPDIPSDLSPARIGSVAIVGAGTMGSGIAMACANAGLTVQLIDETDATLERGLTSIRRNYQSSVKRGRLTEKDVDERVARISTRTGLDEVGTADLVIEAVFEDLALKQSIFRELDRCAKAGAVLGTNTSTLDLDAIARTTSRPESVVGLHFFSPAHVMRLVEVVRGRDTSAATVATALGVAKRLGKLPVVVRNGPGFAGNRMMFPYMYETQYLVEDGCTPEQVDHALTEFGMAMGMFAVDDMAGIDVAQRVRQAMHHFADPSERAPLVQTKLYEMGRLGQKTGKGWYLYGDDRKPKADPWVVDLIRSTARDAGIAERPHTADEIVERCIYALVNEGARVLADGIALRASDLDIIYVNGYGFPAWRGGPMFYADRIGLDVVLARVRAFQQEFGARWTPAPLLERLVQEGRTFRDLDRDPGARLT